jgi:NADPH:quinone reductase-like Zn-dependent oxidoreductase
MAATGPVAFTQLEVGQVGSGTWVLITGATGALGTTLTALATDRGARAIGLSRRAGAIPSQLDLAGRVDVSEHDLAAVLMRLTDSAGVATAIDNVAAGDVFSRYFMALAVGARVVVSGAIGTDELPMLPVPAAPLYLRSVSLLGVRTTTPRDASRFWAMVREGFRLPSELLHEFPLTAAGDAHARITRGATIGHTVLTVPE